MCSVLHLVAMLVTCYVQWCLNNKDIYFFLIKIEQTMTERAVVTILQVLFLLKIVYFENFIQDIKNLYWFTKVDKLRKLSIEEEKSNGYKRKSPFRRVSLHIWRSDNYIYS